MVKSKLIPVCYKDEKNGIQINAYADCIAYAPAKDKTEKDKIVMIRLGGYPESVRAMHDIIWGGGTIHAERNGVSHTFDCLQRQYERTLTHDDLYAEALLYAKDDIQKKADKPNEDTEEKEDFEEQRLFGTKQAPPRKLYIFCEKGDRDRLFREIDRKTYVPLIPEYRDFVIEELQRRGILQKMEVVSVRPLDVWRLRCTEDDANIIEAVESGIRSGVIRIPGGTFDNSAIFESISTVTQYLKEFGPTLAVQIKERFHPLYDPATEPLSPELLQINSHILEKTGYSLYNAQLAVAEATNSRINDRKPVLMVADCGSGKTKIGAAALYSSQLSQGKTKVFNLILCPSHLTLKWVRELRETIPDAVAEVVRGVESLGLFYKAFQKDGRPYFAVMSKEKARDGYMRYPAAVWGNIPQKDHDGKLRSIKQGFYCPSCRHQILIPLKKDGVEYMVEAEAHDFRRENKNNHKCMHCGAPLWSALNPDVQTPWVKVGDYGFTHRKFAAVDAEEYVDDKNLEAMQEVARYPDNFYKAKGAYRAYSLSTFIKKKMRGRIDGLIIDELHQYNNDSGQGDAMEELASTADKVIGMTATLINGYASGLFHLLYRLFSSRMVADNKRHSDSMGFVREYGVLETSYDTCNDYNSMRRTTKSGLKYKMLPGVSPLVYTRFLLDNAVFLSLLDMGKALPEYEEFPVPVEMPPSVRMEYDRIMAAFTHSLQDDPALAQKCMSAFFHLLTLYPDQPYSQKAVMNPFTSLPICEPKDTWPEGALLPKDEEIIALIERKIEAGENVLIYTSWVQINTQSQLINLLTERHIPASVLTSSVPPEKREARVAKWMAEGTRVLITNPTLVETGLDLNYFTTLIFYNISYNLMTLRQAAKRSWRINQTAPRIEVYYYFYIGTMQERAMHLMASKLAVAGVIEGIMTDEGLAAMSDCRDLTAQLAQELIRGIQSNCDIEDLSASFKKMAILKSGDEPEPVPIPCSPAPELAIPESPAPDVPTTQCELVQLEVTAPGELQPEEKIAFVFGASIRRTKKKEAVEFEDQLSLWSPTERSA